MAETIYTKVAGVTFDNDDGVSRQKVIKKYAEEGRLLSLEREPSSQFPNAVAVCIDRYDDDDFVFSDSEKYEEPLIKIGYLNETKAAKIAAIIDSGCEVMAAVADVTGEEKGILGVNIVIYAFTLEETIERNKKREEEKNRPTVVEKQGEQERIIAAPQKDRGHSAANSVPQKPAVKKSEKNLFILLLLWFFLGYFGVHRWYAGRGSWLYTLTLGYLLIGWIIDFFTIIFGLFKDGRGRPIRFF